MGKIVIYHIVIPLRHCETRTLSKKVKYLKKIVSNFDNVMKSNCKKCKVVDNACCLTPCPRSCKLLLCHRNVIGKGCIVFASQVSDLLTLNYLLANLGHSRASNQIAPSKEHEFQNNMTEISQM